MSIEAKNKKISSVKNLTTAGGCLALCIVLPFLTGQIPQIGSALSPMHIPIFLCGFIAGPFYAAITGIIAPISRFLLFGMPPLMPTGIAMCFELTVYGFVSGISYKMLPKKNAFIYVSLVTAMLTGRVVWGIVRWFLSGVADTPFTLEMFMAGAFINAVPGIIVHIALIPVIVLSLKKAGHVRQ